MTDSHNCLEMETQGEKGKEAWEEDSTGNKPVHASEPPACLRIWGCTQVPPKEEMLSGSENRTTDGKFCKEWVIPRSPHQLFVSSWPQSLPCPSRHSVQCYLDLGCQTQLSTEQAPQLNEETGWSIPWDTDSPVHFLLQGSSQKYCHSSLKLQTGGEFPGGLGVGISGFHWCAPGSIPGQGTKTLQVTWQGIN